MTTPSLADMPSYMDRPRRAPGLDVHPPVEEEGRWVLQRGTRYIRVSASVGHLTQNLDGSHDHDALADRLGRPWTADLVQKALARLDELELIDRGDLKEPEPERRLRLVMPLTVQLTLLRPGKRMAAMQPLLTRLARRPLMLFVALVSVGGLGGLAAQADLLKNLLSEPLSLGVYAGVAVALIIGTSIHELGHAGALIRHGGRPSRIGIMLFYLMPAFFCDVSDSWRLPENKQRVKVALAGPAVQTFLAGACSLTALGLQDSATRDVLLLFAIGSYITGLLNLAPFIKLDGYLALMARTDIPYLRDRAMTDARRTLARVLFGGTYAREFPDRRWTTVFGFACILFPLYLLGTALSTWMDVLRAGGDVGGMLVGCGLSYAAYLLGRGAHRISREVRAAGARAWRIVTVTTLLAAACTGLLFVPMTNTVTGAYISTPTGTRIVFATGSGDETVRAGQEVTLLRNGVLLHPEEGRGVIASGRETSQAPLSSFYPVRLGGADVVVPANSYRVELSGPAPQAERGTAQVDAGTRPLWKAAYHTYIDPFNPFG